MLLAGESNHANYTQRFRCLCLQMLKQIKAIMYRVMSLPTFMVIDNTMEEMEADKGYTALVLQTE